MTFLFCLVIASTEYQPQVNDWDFANRDIVSKLYFRCVNQKSELNSIIPQNDIRFYGRENYLSILQKEINWRYQCWNALDDVKVADEVFPDKKLEAIYILYDYLGPILYYCREMPDATIE